MAQKSLRELLKELHRELSHTESLSERDRQLLHHLQNHVSQVMERDPNTAENQDLRDQLEATVAELEAKYPAVTDATERIILTLSNMGI